MKYLNTVELFTAPGISNFRNYISFVTQHFCMILQVAGLYVLETKSNDELKWVEKFQWSPTEETRQCNQAHIPIITFRSLMEVRQCMQNGIHMVLITFKFKN